MARSDWMERLRALVGVELGPPQRARDAVNLPMIRHWCDAMGDENPIYTDAEFASTTRHGGLVAPPTMLQAWTMRGLRPTDDAGPPDRDSSALGLLDEAGFTSVVATNCEQEYFRYLRPGDELSVTSSIESISDEKKTALGVGHFVTQLMTYRDQRDEIVAEMRFRLLKFKPPAGAKENAPGAGTPDRPRRSRPRPGITRDNAFFWEGVREGVLRIQRCADCGRLRHPPGPMCGSCRSLKWNSVAASGRGRIYSFVVAHHPPVPPFEYPNAIVLIELEEGTRLVSNVIGVSTDEIRIGMEVELEFVAVDEGQTLPLFRPSTSGGGVGR